MRQWTGTALVLVLVTSHLIQCWRNHSSVVPYIMWHLNLVTKAHYKVLHVVFEIHNSLKIECKYPFFAYVGCKMLTILFKPGCVNSLWPYNAIWRHRSGSILDQVMSCCLTAPSHFRLPLHDKLTRNLARSTVNVVCGSVESNGQS